MIQKSSICKMGVGAAVQSAEQLGCFIAQGGIVPIKPRLYMHHRHTAKARQPYHYSMGSIQ